MAWFRNHYRCARCNRTWTDEWSCTCDDDCPHCGARHMTPFESGELTIVIDEKPDGTFAVLRSPETAEHKPDYREMQTFATREEATALIAHTSSRPARKVRPASQRQAVDLMVVLERLRDARDHAKRADCPSTLRRIRSALKSAEGAQRHMARRLSAVQL